MSEAIVARESMLEEAARALGRQGVFGSLKDRRVIQSRRGAPTAAFACLRMLLQVSKKMGGNSCLLNPLLHVFLLPG